MKMALFFLFALSLVFGVNIYLFIRGWQALPPYIWVRISYTFVFIVAIACFFLRMYYGDKLPEKVSIAFSAIGFTWLVAVFYLALFALSIDIVRIANHFFKFLPDFIYSNYQLVKLTMAISGIIIVAITLAAGNHKFNNPIVRQVDLSLDKGSSSKEIKIVFASDFHLSYYINRDNLKKYVALINSQKPDLVLLGGDITDRNIEPLLKGKMSEIMAEIVSKYGVYAISGNHEFYNGDRKQIIDYIQSAGITFLVDSAVQS